MHSVKLKLLKLRGLTFKKCHRVRLQVSHILKLPQSQEIATMKDSGFSLFLAQPLIPLREMKT